MEQNAELPVADRMWAWLLQNWKQVAWGAGILAVVACIVALYFWNQQQKVENAAEAMSAVAAQGIFSPRKPAPEAFQKVATEHPGTKAATRALLEAGITLFTQGNYAEAQAQFEKLNREYPDNHFRAQAMLGIASSLDAQMKSDDAARVYKEVTERFPNENVVPQAKFGLARIYESQGKLDQALTLYEDLARGEPNSTLANEAGLKVEELRAKLPKPQTPAPTNAAVLTLPPAAAGATNHP